MNKRNQFLSALLVAQILLVGLTWVTCQSRPTTTGPKPVFDFKTGQITALEFEAKPAEKGKTPESVKLAKKGDSWVIASADDYPAETESVTKVLDALVGLKVREPIATNPADHNTLQVGEKEFGRKITVKTATASKSIVAGSGAGSSIYLRYQGNNDVYQAKGISIWAVPTNVKSYIKTKYIDIDKDKITSVVVTNPKGRLSFTKEGTAWKLAELPSGSNLDDNKVTALINKASALTFNDPISRTLKPEYGLPGDTEVVIVSTDKDTTATTRLIIGAQKGEQDFYAKADNKDYVVTISKYDANQLRDKAVEDFVKKEK
jgi:hypothetical protein